MGWAKYYEDNLSIINHRENLRNPVDNHPAIEVLLNSVPKKPSADNLKRRERAELEIHFLEAVDRLSARKLQINGWWRSRLNNCWCNYNTVVNIAFAQSLYQKEKILIKNTFD